jgi:hypothetical protein
MTDDTHVVGKRPTAEDKFWITEAGKTTPESSIKRLDEHGKYLFSVVSIVGTLLTGFGIYSSAGANALRNPWLLLPVALACLSLALSMMGLTPKAEDVNLRDINSVRDYYHKLISRRGRFIFWAGVAFSLSLLSVAIVQALPLKSPSLAPAISVTFADAEGKTKLTGKIDFQELPRSGVTETNIIGYKDTDKSAQHATLFKDITHADSSGKATISAQLEPAKEYKRFVISSKVTSGGKLLYERELEVTR